MKKLWMFLILILFLNCGSVKIADEGIFDRVEYQTGSFGSRDLTIIYWEDGHTFVLKQIKSIDMKRGIFYKIRMEKNLWSGNRKITVKQRRKDE